MIAYFDSSVVVRRYLRDEPFSEEAIGFLSRSPQRNLVGRLGRVEAIRAISAAERNARISASERGQLLRMLEVDLRADFELIEISTPAWVNAEAIVRDHPVRSPDALHIATALVLSSLIDGGDTLVFVTADGRQADAAVAAGLTVELVGEPLDPAPAT